MKAVILEGKRKLELKDVEAPSPNGKDTIIRLDKCGICGSDFHFLYDNGDALKGMIMGHEFSGIVVDPGANAEVKEGDRVTVVPSNACGVCELCKSGATNACATNFGQGLGVSTYYNGAYAEYIAVRPDTVIKLSDSVSMLEASMAEPAAVGVHAVKRGRVSLGDKVLIIGAGIIGSVCATFARKAGATYVALIETNMEKAEKSLNFGDCDAIFDARDKDCIQKAIESNGGKQFDVVFECSGAGPAMNSAIQLTRPKGVIVLAGGNPELYQIPLIQSVFAEHDILPIYGYTEKDFKIALEYIENKLIDVKKYATKIVRLEEVPDVFIDFFDNKLSDTKIVIDFSE